MNKNIKYVTDIKTIKKQKIITSVYSHNFL